MFLRIVKLFIYLFCLYSLLSYYFSCFAEIADGYKHCSECGAKQTTESVEKKSFSKNKKVLLGCCVGVFVIFLIVAVIGFSGTGHTNGFSKIYTGYYDDLGDMG